MHGSTADTLFMFDSGAEGLSVCETERDCDTVCLCVYRGEKNRVKEARTWATGLNPACLTVSLLNEFLICSGS